MKIGPVDVRNHTFNRKMRGVDEHEVRDYLDLVADRLEEAILEAEDLRGRIDRLEAEVRDFRAVERSLRDSMLSAERLVDDRSAQAEKEAQIVIRNAEVQAGKILLQAREELGRLKAEVDDLRRQKVTYVERFRALLRSQGKILEASLESFDPDADTPGGEREPERAPAPPARETGPASRPAPSMSSYVTRAPAVPPAPPGVSPPADRSGPDSEPRSGAPWEPTGAAQGSFTPYAGPPAPGQEGLFGGGALEPGRDPRLR
jgi:cell division initiation protein